MSSGGCEEIVAGFCGNCRNSDGSLKFDSLFVDVSAELCITLKTSANRDFIPATLADVGTFQCVTEVLVVVMVAVTLLLSTSLLCCC